MPMRRSRLYLCSFSISRLERATRALSTLLCFCIPGAMGSLAPSVFLLDNLRATEGFVGLPLSERAGDVIPSGYRSSSDDLKSYLVDVMGDKVSFAVGHSGDFGRPLAAMPNQFRRGGMLELPIMPRKRRTFEGGARASQTLVARGGAGKPVFQESRVSIRWPMFTAFLYFLSMAFTIPSIPRVVNTLLNGSPAVTATSAAVYGLLSSTDASFTFLTVNFHASMSDKYGRRPFLALSSLGLGLGFLTTYSSSKVWTLILAATVDGCTSCMYSIAQACITDCVGSGQRLSEAFGIFQGFALGTAFMIGLPMGGVLAARYGIKFPLLVGAAICAANFVLVTFFMPETLPASRRREKVDLAQANPLGAARLAGRNELVTGVMITWVLIWIAQVGFQINWINYTDRKFQWGVAQSGASLALMGLMVGIFPKIIIPRFGVQRSITHALLAFALSQLVIASAPGAKSELKRLGTPLATMGLALAAAGSVVFPASLAILSNQVGEEEKGAMQGSADTAKTIVNVLFGPFMSLFFGYFVGENAYPKQIEGASYYLGSVIALMAWVVARRTFSSYGGLDKTP